jgi:hypothetical protein
MRTRRFLYRAAALGAAATAVLGVTLTVAAGPASALPRSCASLEQGYYNASDLAAYWYGQYSEDLATNVDYAVGVDYPNYRDYEAARVSYAQAIMDFC